MSLKLKPLDRQVVVIAGASSGIGLAIAERAVKQGAEVVLAARLDGLDGGGEVPAVECDVADPAQVEQVAQAAVDRFGRIDTWVNNAGVSIFGGADEVTPDDAKTSPIMEKKVGAMSTINTNLARLFPPLFDKLAQGQAERQHYDEPTRDGRGALHRPSQETGVVGQTAGLGPQQ